MNILARGTALAFAALAVLATSAPSYAQVARPLPAQAAVSADNPVTEVRWRGGWGWGPGLAAGALIGAGIAASRPYYYSPYYYGPAYYGPGYDGPPPPNDAAAYCMQRYRSYDPASGTFLGYDGLRHPCP